MAGYLAVVEEGEDYPEDEMISLHHNQEGTTKSTQPPTPHTLSSICASNPLFERGVLWMKGKESWLAGGGV